jgi:soluble lytic murein transglycosylase
MQILPRTAKTIAKQEKIPYFDAKELFHPEKNLQIGVAYINTLHHQFKAHPVLIMAAYNAGPKQVRHWVTRHSPKEMDVWIETLPWQETRNYLKNVISFYAVYQYRMQQKPNLSSFFQPF